MGLWVCGFISCEIVEWQVHMLLIVAIVTNKSVLLSCSTNFKMSYLPEWPPPSDPSGGSDPLESIESVRSALVGLALKYRSETPRADVKAASSSVRIT